MNEGQIRSTGAEGKTNYTITNRTKDTITVYWLDYEGHRKRWFDVEPGKTGTESGTYSTHPWLAADSKGKCLKIFSIPPDSNQEIIVD